MKVNNYVRILGLLRRLGQEHGPHPKVVEQPDLSTPEGLQYDLYLPRRKKPVGTMVALQGVTVHGRKEPRLVHFARCLARSGVCCAVPTLEGMSCCCWMEQDVTQLEGLVPRLAREMSHKVGLIGFSYGASFGLTAAAHPEVAPHVRFVLAFGPYHGLGDLLRWYAEDEANEPSNEKELDDRIYLHMVLAFMRHHHHTRLDKQLHDDLRALMLRFCHHATPEEKLRFYQQRLLPLELVPGELSYLQQNVRLDRFSPAGKLDGLPFSVSVIHDREDTMVTPDHSERIHAELHAGRVAGVAHRLLVTGLLDHVSLKDLTRVKEIGALLGALAPVIQ